MTSSTVIAINLRAILDATDRKIDLHHRRQAVLGDLFKVPLYTLMTGEILIDKLDLSELPDITHH